MRFLNRALRVLLITNGLILVAGAMLGPIYALFVRKIGGDLLGASLTGASFSIAAGLTTLLAGRYADHSQRSEYIVAGGYTLMGVGFLLYIIVASIWSLLCVELLIGFAEAAYAPAFDRLYTRHLASRKVGREWGMWEGVSYFSNGLGAMAGGIVVALFGFNILFVVMGALCFGSALYMLALPRNIL